VHAFQNSIEFNNISTDLEFLIGELRARNPQSVPVIPVMSEFLLGKNGKSFSVPLTNHLLNNVM
jgi:hypothetical protein